MRLLLLVVLLAVEAFAADRAGEVISMLRSPEVKAPDSSEWRTLSVGDEIAVGDRVRTGNGKIKLLLVDDTVLTLDEGSEMSISKHVFRPKEQSRTGFFTLWSGRVKALVGSFVGDTDVQIKTPTAVAGVRGTHFVVEITPAKTAQADCQGGDCGPADDSGGDPSLLGATRVFVLEGTVNLGSGGQDMNLTAGLTGLMNSGGILEQARQISPGEMASIKSSLNFRSRGKALQLSSDIAGSIDDDAGLTRTNEVAPGAGRGPEPLSPGARPAKQRFGGAMGAQPNGVPPGQRLSVEPGISTGTRLRIHVPQGVK